MSSVARRLNRERPHHDPGSDPDVLARVHGAAAAPRRVTTPRPSAASALVVTDSRSAATTTVAPIRTAWRVSLRRRQCAVATAGDDDEVGRPSLSSSQVCGLLAHDVRRPGEDRREVVARIVGGDHDELAARRAESHGDHRRQQPGAARALGLRRRQRQHDPRRPVRRRPARGRPARARRRPDRAGRRRAGRGATTASRPARRSATPGGSRPCAAVRRSTERSWRTSSSASRASRVISRSTCSPSSSLGPSSPSATTYVGRTIPASAPAIAAATVEHGADLVGARRCGRATTRPMRVVSIGRLRHLRAVARRATPTPGSG